MSKEEKYLEASLSNLLDNSDILVSKTEVEQRIATFTPGLLGKISFWASSKSWIKDLPGGSKLHQNMQRSESSPWRLLAEKVLPKKLTNGFSSTVTVKKELLRDNLILKDKFKEAFNEAFGNPAIFVNNDKNPSSVDDPAYKSVDVANPNIVSDFQNAKIKKTKSPSIVFLTQADFSDSSKVKNTVKKLQKTILSSPFVLIHFPGGDGKTDIALYSSHLPLDGVTAAAILQKYAATLTGEENVIKTNDLLDNDLVSKLAFSDAVETHDDVVSKSLLISGEEFGDLHNQYLEIKSKYMQKDIDIPESVYYWLRILASLKIDGKKRKAANLRFSERIDIQLSLYDLGDAQRVLQALNDENLSELESLGYLANLKDGSKRLSFTRKHDIVAETVRPLIQALPAVAFNFAWKISEIIGIVSAVSPNMHISTMPTEIELPNGMKLVVDVLASTALSDRENFAIVMMLHQDKLILRAKHRNR